MSSHHLVLNPILTAIRGATAHPFVVSVHEHYDLRWNELEVFVTVADETSDAFVIALRNELLTVINDLSEESGHPVNWQIAFRRHSGFVDILSPGDDIKPVTDRLCFPVESIHGNLEKADSTAQA